MIKNNFYPKKFQFIFFLISFFLVETPSYSTENYGSKNDKKNLGHNALDNTLEKTLENSSKNNFYIKPAISIEYNAPGLSGAGDNKRFATTDHIFKQIYKFENIAIGAHIRFHDHFGLNANWVQTSLDSPVLKDTQIINKKAVYKIDHYNFSLLSFAPVIKNYFELFGELGLSDMHSNLAYTDVKGNSVNRNSHQTRIFYSAGLQIIFNDYNAFRFSAQRYVGKVGLINSDYTTLRIGFLRFF